MSEANNMKWSPEKYAEAAVIAREAGNEMLARLEWMTLQPKLIVEMGCGTGELSAQLQTRYPDAQVIAVDQLQTMVTYAKSQHDAKVIYMHASADALPFPDQSIDLIVANFLIPWHPDFTLLLQEWRRLLTPNGLLMVSALGPDTMREWHAVCSPTDRPFCLDMHDLGDALLQEHFADPVLDVDTIRLIYKNKEKLISELQASSMLWSDDPTIPDEETLSVTYEVIHAHAFAPEQSTMPPTKGITQIPLTSLRQQLKTPK